jgi:hypothetical protein|tara:strand:+ start:4430 stop:4684 length:255 start_codon:yes stop_codon:yes gene_type:complete
LNKGFKNKIIKEYYDLTLYEIENGLTIEEVQIMLREYESNEMYLECAGILTAIEWVKFALLVSVIKIVEIKKIKINIKHYAVIK